MAGKVLIVDDIRFVRNCIREMLEDTNYEVVGEAENGIAAIQEYLKLRPDIVIMDIVMPQMSGIQATLEIIKQNSDAVIIMVSAIELESIVMEAINAGAKDFIVKPFSKDQFLMALDNMSELHFRLKQGAVGR